MTVEVLGSGIEGEQTGSKGPGIMETVLMVLGRLEDGIDADVGIDTWGVAGLVAVDIEATKGRSLEG